ncbi:hypothetical protein [Bradyrhizobium retamae]|uniref:hypothetical protein n=1 Tax=Bradyrhizobium retamae TaxID=1300035 RepID=UPI000ABD470D|nr:hypothetical protein [Bradyrhizobium retamae]
MHGERRKWNKLTHAADVDGTDAAKACGGKPIRETLLERYGPWVDAAKSCV